jgi:CubicO group peptidase (beta-lactamase class C family)
MGAHVLSEEGASKLRGREPLLFHSVSLTEVLNLTFVSEIDAATADPTTQIPGIVACVVNKDGKTIFSHASGKRGAHTNELMTLDSIFWIASCTKMIGGIVCMQLVEQGTLSLDDADLAEKLCPELKEVKILKGYGQDEKPILVEKKNRITLRKLLSHTCE